MPHKSTKFSMIENEAYFRQQNEHVRHNFEEIVKIAKESHQEYLIRNDDAPLYFYCECSDENCRQRILMKPSLYNRIHAHRRRFILMPGHESAAIEHVITERKTYIIVEKSTVPPENNLSLNDTPVAND